MLTGMTVVVMVMNIMTMMVLDDDGAGGDCHDDGGDGDEYRDDDGVG